MSKSNRGPEIQREKVQQPTQQRQAPERRGEVAAPLAVLSAAIGVGGEGPGEGAAGRLPAAHGIAALRGLNRVLGNHLAGQATSPRPPGTAARAHGARKSSIVQAKLFVSSECDPLEKEADALADALLRPLELSPPPRADGPGDGPTRAAGGPAIEWTFAPSAAQAVGLDVPEELGARLLALESGGSPLMADERAFFEARFGVDLADVRVHADAASAGLCTALQARAFAHGRHIALGSEATTLGTADARRLMAHELVHVLQQGALPLRPHAGGEALADGPAPRRYQLSHGHESVVMRDALHRYEENGIIVEADLSKGVIRVYRANPNAPGKIIGIAEVVPPKGSGEHEYARISANLLKKKWTQSATKVELTPDGGYKIVPTTDADLPKDPPGTPVKSTFQVVTPEGFTVRPYNSASQTVTHRQETQAERALIADERDEVTRFLEEQATKELNEQIAEYNKHSLTPIYNYDPFAVGFSLDEGQRARLAARVSTREEVVALRNSPEFLQWKARKEADAAKWRAYAEIAKFEEEYIRTHSDVAMGHIVTRAEAHKAWFDAKRAEGLKWDAKKKAYVQTDALSEAEQWADFRSQFQHVDDAKAKILAQAALMASVSADRLKKGSNCTDDEKEVARRMAAVVGMDLEGDSPKQRVLNAVTRANQGNILSFAMNAEALALSQGSDGSEEARHWRRIIDGYNQARAGVTITPWQPRDRPAEARDALRSDVLKKLIAHGMHPDDLAQYDLKTLQFWLRRFRTRDDLTPWEINRLRDVGDLPNEEVDEDGNLLGYKFVKVEEKGWMGGRLEVTERIVDPWGQNKAIERKFVLTPATEGFTVIADFIVDRLPYVGTLKNFLQAVAGVSLSFHDIAMGGRLLSPGERIESAFGAIPNMGALTSVTHVVGKAMQAKMVLELVTGIGLSGPELDDLFAGHPKHLTPREIHERAFNGGLLHIVDNHGIGGFREALAKRRAPNAAFHGGRPPGHGPDGAHPPGHAPDGPDGQRHQSLAEQATRALSGHDLPDHQVTMVRLPSGESVLVRPKSAMESVSAGSPPAAFQSHDTVSTPFHMAALEAQHNVRIEVDPTRGNGIAVGFTKDQFGLVTSITVTVGPKADASDFARHAQVINALREYQGAAGVGRVLVDFLHRRLGRIPQAPGEPGFLIAHEVGKLRELMQDRVAKLDHLDSAERVEVLNEIKHLRDQLTHFETRVSDPSWDPHSIEMRNTGKPLKEELTELHSQPKKTASAQKREPARKRGADRADAAAAAARGGATPADAPHTKFQFPTSATLPGGKSVEATGVAKALYHGANVSPETVLANNGFPARGKNPDILNHVNEGPDTMFRGATTDVTNMDRDNAIGAAHWADDGHWVYHIAEVPYWDTNKVLDGQVWNPLEHRFGGNPKHGEHEMAIPAEVPLAHIVAWGKVERSRAGQLHVPHWTSNPHFNPTTVVLPSQAAKRPPVVEPVFEIEHQAGALGRPRVKVIRDAGAGDGVHVDYRLHESSGLLASVTVRVGPNARPDVVAKHAAVVDVLLRYQGVSGWLRNLLGRVKALFTANRDRIIGEHAFNVREELEKLPGIQKVLIEEAAKSSPEMAEHLMAKVQKIEAQMRKLEASLVSLEAEANPGRTISMDDTTKRGDGGDEPARAPPPRQRRQPDFIDPRKPVPADLAAYLGQPDSRPLKPMDWKDPGAEPMTIQGEIRWRHGITNGDMTLRLRNEQGSAAYLHADFNPESGDLFVGRIEVNPDRRFLGKGLSTKMMDHALELIKAGGHDLRSVTGEFYETNFAALQAGGVYGTPFTKALHPDFRYAVYWGGRQFTLFKSWADVVAVTGEHAGEPPPSNILRPPKKRPAEPGGPVAATRPPPSPLAPGDATAYPGVVVGSGFVEGDAPGATVRTRSRKADDAGGDSSGPPSSRTLRDSMDSRRAPAARDVEVWSAPTVREPTQVAPPPSDSHAALELLRARLLSPENHENLPNLGQNFRVVGKATHEYNCIVHSVGLERGWFQPGVSDKARPMSHMDDFYTAHGFQRAPGMDTAPQDGVERVVVFGMRDETGQVVDVTHAVRQEPNGKWTSKLGTGPLIEHDTLSQVRGGSYGEPIAVYERRSGAAGEGPPSTAIPVKGSQDGGPPGEPPHGSSGSDGPTGRQKGPVPPAALAPDVFRSPVVEQLFRAQDVSWEHPAARAELDPVRRLLRLVGNDTATGAHAPEVLPTVLASAQQHIEQHPGQSIKLITVEVKNLGGLNTDFGTTGANRVLGELVNQMTSTMRLSLMEERTSVTLVRLGGAKLALVVVGPADGRTVNRAVREGLLRARQVADTIEEPLLRDPSVKGRVRDMRHPKYPNDPRETGSGISVLHSMTVDPATPVSDVLARRRAVISRAVEGQDAIRRGRNPEQPGVAADASEAPVAPVAPPLKGRQSRFEPGVETALRDANTRLAADADGPGAAPRAALREAVDATRAVAVDRTTGLYSRGVLVPTLENVIDWKRTHPGESGAVVVFDVKNLSGMSDHLGSDQADVHFKAMIAILERVQGEALPTAKLVGIRFGGDEFGFVVVGSYSPAQLHAAVSKANLAVERYVDSTRVTLKDKNVEVPLRAVPHRKQGKPPGTGVTAAIVPIGRRTTPREILGAMDALDVAKAAAKPKKKGEPPEGTSTPPVQPRGPVKPPGGPPADAAADASGPGRAPQPPKRAAGDFIDPRRPLPQDLADYLDQPDSRPRKLEDWLDPGDAPLETRANMWRGGAVTVTVDNDVGSAGNLDGKFDAATGHLLLLKVEVNPKLRGGALSAKMIELAVAKVQESGAEVRSIGGDLYWTNFETLQKHGIYGTAFVRVLPGEFKYAVYWGERTFNIYKHWEDVVAVTGGRVGDQPPAELLRPPRPPKKGEPPDGSSAPPAADGGGPGPAAPAQQQMQPVGVRIRQSPADAAPAEVPLSPRASGQRQQQHQQQQMQQRRQQQQRQPAQPQPQPQQQQQARAGQPGPARTYSHIPGGSLDAHERARGNGVGHTLRDHVGKDVEALHERASDPTKYPVASTFLNETAANYWVNECLSARAAEIQAWLASGPAAGEDRRFSVRGSGVTGNKVVRRMRSGEYMECTDVVVILRPHPRNPGQYFILTAYPE